MREKFWGYIPPSNDDFKKLWKEADIILDANILLDLYRYSSTSRASSFNLFEMLSDRVRITEVSMGEYFNNRLNTYNENKNIKDNLCTKINFEGIRDEIKAVRHNLFETALILKYVEDFENKVNKHLLDIEKRIGTDGDSTLKKIIKLFDGKIISNFSIEKLEQLYKEGEIRYNKKIPPGYKDDKKNSPEKYNDYITWEIMIKYSIDNDKDIIFVSEDIKEDWITQIHGKKIGPREDLLNEFYKRTHGKMIYIYSTMGFFEGYQKYVEELDVKSLILETEKINELKYYEKINSYYKNIENYDYDSNIDKKMVKRLSLNSINKMLSEQRKRLEELLYLRKNYTRRMSGLVDENEYNNSGSNLKEIYDYDEKITMIDEEIKSLTKKLIDTEEIFEYMDLPGLRGKLDYPRDDIQKIVDIQD